MRRSSPRKPVELLAALCAAACVTPGERAGGVVLAPEHAEPDLVCLRYVVQPGQTLYRIARAYGLSADELALANGVSDPRALKVGQELCIPGATEAVPLAATAGPDPDPEEERAGTVRLPVHPRPPTDPHRLALGWPLKGVLYARFGKKGRQAHDGIDLAAPTGTPVKAAAAGTVLFAGEQRGYGKIVILEHVGQCVTLYAHNQGLKVSAGQKVDAGEEIATVGESGRTTGPHLHFEVRQGGVPADPLDYLGAIPPSP